MKIFHVLIFWYWTMAARRKCPRQLSIVRIFRRKKAFLLKHKWIRSKAVPVEEITVSCLTYRNSKISEEGILVNKNSTAKHFEKSRYWFLSETHWMFQTRARNRTKDPRRGKSGVFWSHRRRRDSTDTSRSSEPMKETPFIQRQRNPRHPSKNGCILVAGSDVTGVWRGRLKL